jgi:methylthioribulose-1-phosphate dehydratase
MTPKSYSIEAQALCDLCHLFGERGWCRATSGNFSLRIEESFCLITQSGKEKSQLQPDDLMICDLEGRAIDADCRPSAETPLHTRLYQLDSAIGTVLHTHSIAATLLSRHGGSQLEFSGFEMQKALAGVRSHDDTVAIPIFNNDQDMQALAEHLTDSWGETGLAVPGFLLRGHGLYAWGKDATEAQRHVEGFEFLFECRWQEMLARLS